MITLSCLFSFPTQTIFDAGDEGVVAMALTPDARYLATISAGTPQVVHLSIHDLISVLKSLTNESTYL